MSFAQNSNPFINPQQFAKIGSFDVIFEEEAFEFQLSQAEVEQLLRIDTRDEEINNCHQSKSKSRGKKRSSLPKQKNSCSKMRDRTKKILTQNCVSCINSIHEGAERSINLNHSLRAFIPPFYAGQRKELCLIKESLSSRSVDKDNEAFLIVNPLDMAQEKSKAIKQKRLRRYLI